MKQEVQVLITLEWDPDTQLINTEEGVLKAILNTYAATMYKCDKTGEYFPKIIASSIKKEKPDIQLRPAVDWFTDQMELKLRDNDYMLGWGNRLSLTLYGKLGESFLKLHKHILNQKHVPNLRDIDRKIKKECIDLANYAMMIADLNEHKFGK